MINPLMKVSNSISNSVSGSAQIAALNVENLDGHASGMDHSTNNTA